MPLEEPYKVNAAWLSEINEVLAKAPSGVRFCLFTLHGLDREDDSRRAVEDAQLVTVANLPNRDIVRTFVYNCLDRFGRLQTTIWPTNGAKR